MKFRRATHDRAGKYREELRNDPERDRVWRDHGDVGHHLCSRRAMSFDELYTEMENDWTNYLVGGKIGPNDDRSPLPSRDQVAYALVRLIEAGLVEVTDS